MTRVLLTLASPSPRQVGRRAHYIAALERAGAEVVPLFPGEVAPAEYDALLLSGGGDIHPRRYGEAVDGSTEIDETRDELELTLTARALERGVPILGICRGFQLLNVALGGSLAQHVDGHRPPEGDLPLRHRACASRQSRLAVAMGTDPVDVNSWHHQAVTPERLAPGLVPTVVIRGVVEALELDRADRWVVGVQWHPERSHEVDAPAIRVFDAFVRAAR
ncbi:MAG TPA: gamma-glutamyl-gamma-aminobutyrate hydrolase family protein [Candidatus Limnocylindria bacterium]|nr:gamma-glutamyl-gamma-aminobutyrate hydrolase family protein [Candidatus Limnocylindria bacterium]